MIEVFRDGFGTRTVELDEESGDAVEVLSFAPELVATPDFGAAVGERVARLSRVRRSEATVPIERTVGPRRAWGNVVRRAGTLGPITRFCHQRRDYLRDARSDSEHPTRLGQ